MKNDLPTHVWTNSLDRHSPIPLHQQLSDILAKSIEDDTLKPGDHLPSENKLIKIFDVSRYVVRQTLTNLGRQGLIYTEHGRGSFVCRQRIEKPLDVLQSYHESMRKSGQKVDVRIHEKRMVNPPEDIARQLELSGKEVFYLDRVAYIDDSPVNILISYIAPGRFGEEELMQFSGGSLYEYLAKRCKVCLKRSRSFIEVVFAEEYESRLLNIPRSSVLLQIVGLVFDKDNQPVEYSRVVYPGTMFRFRFDSYMDDQVDESKRYVLT